MPGASPPDEQQDGQERQRPLDEGLVGGDPLAGGPEVPALLTHAALDPAVGPPGCLAQRHRRSGRPGQPGHQGHDKADGEHDPRARCAGTAAACRRGPWPPPVSGRGPAEAEMRNERARPRMMAMNAMEAARPIPDHISARRWRGDRAIAPAKQASDSRGRNRARWFRSFVSCWAWTSPLDWSSTICRLSLLIGSLSKMLMPRGVQLLDHVDRQGVEVERDLCRSGWRETALAPCPVSTPTRACVHCPVHRHPDLVELVRGDDLVGERECLRLDGVGQRRGEEVGLGREDALDLFLDVDVAEELVGDLAWP